MILYNFLVVTDLMAAIQGRTAVMASDTAEMAKMKKTVSRFIIRSQ